MNILKNTILLAILSTTAAFVYAEETAPSSVTVSAATVDAATAAPTVQIEKQRANTVIVSPRTGMRYVVNNPENRPVIFKTEVIAAATSENADRIIATNPALSVQSQQKAKDVLVQLVQPVPTTAPVQEAAPELPVEASSVQTPSSTSEATAVPTSSDVSAQPSTDAQPTQE